MLRITLRGLLQYKVRFALTTFAVIVGVSFVVTAFTLTDTVRGQFDQVFSEINANVDLTVRGQKEVDAGPFTPSSSVDEGLLAQIEDQPGIAAASGSVGGTDVMLLARDGAAVAPPMGGMSIGLAGTDPDLSHLTTVAGHPPIDDTEIAIDVDLAARSGFGPGDAVTVMTPLGPRPYTVTGTFRFGSSNARHFGATLISFTISESQRLFNLEGRFQTIDIHVASGASIDQVQAGVASLLPTATEVVPTSDIVSEGKASAGDLFDVLGNVLVGFGILTLFVSGFLIFNTFLIVVSQRIRDLALLRAIGASTRQVAMAILGEAAVVGIVASAIGLGLGLLQAYLLNALLDARGFGTGDLSLVIESRSIILALVIGVGVTIASAVYPAIAATSVPPVAAVDATSRLPSWSPQTVALIGFDFAAVGSAVIAFGLVTRPATPALVLTVGGGSMLVLIGAISMSTVLAGPFCGVVGYPLRWLFATTGRLANENATRDPSRTAFSAAALLVGLTLVSAAAVVGTSVRASLRDNVESSVSADWFVEGQGQSGFSPLVTGALDARPELAAVSGSRRAQVDVRGSTTWISSIDPGAVDQLFELDFRSGGPVPGTHGVMVGSDAAGELGLRVGDLVALRFPEHGPVELPVVGIYDNTAILGDWIVDQDTMSTNVTAQTVLFVAARSAPGVDAAVARQAVDEVVAAYPQVVVRDRDGFTQSRSTQVDRVLGVVGVFLLLAVLIALVGIVNTLALSVIERTHELALLRTVGQQRSQTAGMIALESIVVSLFGAAVGVAVGAGLGMALCGVLPHDLVTTVVVPTEPLVGLLLAAGLAGALASLYPAWRASRLDILGAIAVS